MRQFSFGYDLVYNICLPTIKFSILLFYARIFPSRRFRIALWITGSYVMAWFIWNFFGGIFLCDPPAKAWNSTLPGHCVDTVKVVLASAAVNISADVIILCLPMYTLWRLQVSRGQKVALTGIFLLGGLLVALILLHLDPADSSLVCALPVSFDCYCSLTPMRMTLPVGRPCYGGGHSLANSLPPRDGS